VKLSLLVISLTVAYQTKAQVADTALLTPLVVKGFENNRKLFETPASINVLSAKDLGRFNSTSLVPILNTLPGIRMEERSPGSYRLSIRGSLLRSPFGIRNIKVYIDDLPFTDAGGNTYLNLIEPTALQQAEILKGPASSLYGAGTGGAVILNTTSSVTNVVAKNKFAIQLQGGSYGLLAQNFTWRHTTKKQNTQLTQSHLQSDGYRQNSNMRKDVAHVSSTFKLRKNDELKFHLLLADLLYQTPGGLTESQWLANPRQARQATASLPSAVQQKAAVYNKTIFLGASNKIEFLNKLTNITSVVFSTTDFKNPFITNYEKRNENSRGIRTKIIYNALQKVNTNIKLIAGAEWQTTFSRINNFGNKTGVADTIQTKDEVNAYQRFYFLQADVIVKNKLFINLGASVNQFTYKYVRTNTIPLLPKKLKDFTAVISPRVAATYTIIKNIAARIIISNGFSAPTIAEVRPSEGSFFESLQAESGWNYETGLRGNFLKNHFQYDISFYQFNLSNAIVRRSTSTGAEYFINAGGTVQKGLEAMMSYQIKEKLERFISQLKITSSFTLNNYRFKDYKINATDFSGNRLTGVPNNVVVIVVDAVFKKSFYINTTYNYTDKIPLTDANNLYTEGYHLLQCKTGYKATLKRIQVNFFVGADNVFNERYSLGNDINAAGNRFFNASPLRNYFAGISFNL
jgi:iron complex outermembrane recepter protein